MLPHSVLDLSPIAQGASPADALHHSLDLAQHAEKVGLSTLLAGGASQHARHCQCGDLGGDWLRCGRNENDPRGIGRHHAAESFAAGHRRAVWDARFALSGPHRPRAGARTRHGHGYGSRTASRSAFERRPFSGGCPGIAVLPGAGAFGAEGFKPFPVRARGCRSGFSVPVSSGAQLAAHLGLCPLRLRLTSRPGT